MRFGFVEVPNLALALTRARDEGCPVDLDDAVFFAARDEVVPSKTRPRLPAWQRMLFGFMYHNAVRTPDRFDLSADKFIEVSRQVELQSALSPGWRSSSAATTKRTRTARRATTTARWETSTHKPALTARARQGDKHWRHARLTAAPAASPVVPISGLLESNTPAVPR